MKAELYGSDTCTALGITVHSPSPVLALCRKLVDTDHDPATPLDVYRGDTLALRVKSIGAAARLRVSQDKTGRPIFKVEESTAGARHVRPIAEAAE
jgi:hypothetical protein